MNWYKKLCPDGFEKPSSLFTSRTKKSVLIKDELLTAQTSTLNQSGALAKMPISLSQQQLDNIHLVLEGGESTRKAGKHQQHASAGGSADKVNQINQVCKLTDKQLIDNELHEAPSSITVSKALAQKNEELQRVPSTISLGSYSEDTYGLYSSSEPETCMSGGIYHSPFQPDVQQGVAIKIIEILGEFPNKSSSLNCKLKCKRLKSPKKSALAAWKDKAINALSHESDNTVVEKIFGLNDDGNVVIYVVEDIPVAAGLEVVVKSGLKKFLIWQLLKAREMKQETKLKTASSIIKRILKSLRAAFKGNISIIIYIKTFLLNHP